MARINYPENPSLDDVFTDPNTGIRRRCVSIDPDVWDYEKGATNTGVPLLTGFWKLGNAADPGYVFLTDTRQSFSRVTYAAAWAKIQTSGMLALTEGAALDGQFGPGDGSTTFTVPNAAGYMPRIIGGVDPDVRALGDVQEDAFQGHWHEKAFTSESATTAGGSTFYAWNKNVVADGSALDDNGDPIVRNATSDGVNGTPRVASETRPKNIAWNFQIKLYDAVDDPAQVNAAQVVADVALNTAAAARLLGEGQSFDAAVVRAFDTAYQNDTGRTIQVMVSMTTEGNNVTFDVGPDGSAWTSIAEAPSVSSATGEGGTFSIPVPDGVYYRVQRASVSTQVILRWAELR